MLWCPLCCGFFFAVLMARSRGGGRGEQAGGQPRCLMDFWAQRCLEEVAEAEAAGVPPPGHTSDASMADTVSAAASSAPPLRTHPLVQNHAPSFAHCVCLTRGAIAGPQQCEHALACKS